ncbi:MAG: response regulator [Geothrix sp.]|nr:response regulator [Geothrix sp.]
MPPPAMRQQVWNGHHEGPLALALDAAGLATWEWHIPSGEARWNPRHFELLGYEQGEVQPSYEAWIARVHPADRVATEALLEQALTQGSDYAATFRVLRPDGSIRWLEARGRFDCDSGGKAEVSYGVVLDVTVEQLLRESEARFRMTLKNAPITVATLDRDLRYTWVYNTRHGFSADMVLGRRPDELIPAADAAELMGLLQRVLDTGEPEVREVSGETRGRPWHYSDYVEPVRDAAGRIQGLNVAMIEITERKQAEAALRDAKTELEHRVATRTAELVGLAASLQSERRRLYDVLEALPAYVVLLSPELRIIFANRDFERRFGKPPDTTCHAHLFQREEPCEGCESLRVLQTLASNQCEWQGPDGHDYEVSTYPFVDTDGSRLLMRVGIDITHRKQAEVALLQRTRQLANLAVELTMAEHHERKRLAQVLHDGLQQLLVAAKYRVGALEGTGDTRVQEEVHHLEELLVDSIETSRTLTYELSPPFLGEQGLLPALEWLARWKQTKHGLRVGLQVGRGLPPISEDQTILLFQAVRELLFNVVKHAGTKVARLSVQAAGDGLQIVVTDEGVGFDPARLRLAGSEAGGYGLLSLHERLGLLGGRLEIQSSPGLGSRFTLTVPLRPERPDTVEATQARVSLGPLAKGAGPSEGTAPLRPIRLLLVDDHTLVRQGLGTLLRQEQGIQLVGEAADGASALDQVDRLRPDVVLMDIQMPGMSGIEATRIIHQRFPQVQIIGLSMHQDVDMAEAMRAAGAVDYVSKSDLSDTILAAILACRAT